MSEPQAGESREPDAGGLPAPAPRRRFSPAELVAAADRTIPDLIRPGLRVLFVGINPGLYSAATGWHFARPGNRFWKVLHLSGFTERQLDPSEQHLLLDVGVGITNVVPRASATAAELEPDELAAGGARLEGLVRANRPGTVAVLGMQAYRRAFARPRAGIGPQPEPLGGRPVWLLPNPSGLQARYQLPELVELFIELRQAAEG